MTEPMTCPACGRAFTGHNGLWQHLKAKGGRDRAHNLGYRDHMGRVRAERRAARDNEEPSLAEIAVAAEEKRRAGEELDPLERSLIGPG